MEEEEEEVEVEKQGDVFQKIEREISPILAKKLDHMHNAIKFKRIGKGIVSEDQYWVPIVADIVLYPK